MSDNSITKQQLHHLIGQYFDAGLDRADEERLRILLARTTHRSPEIDEARAVMGIFATARNRRRATASVRTLALRLTAAAASVALIAGAVTMFMTSPHQADESVMIAYTDGDKVEDETFIFNQMSNDLSSLAEATMMLDDCVTDDLADLASAMPAASPATNQLNYITL